MNAVYALLAVAALICAGIAAGVSTATGAVLGIVAALRSLRDFSGGDLRTRVALGGDSRALSHSHHLRTAESR